MANHPIFFTYPHQLLWDRLYNELKYRLLFQIRQWQGHLFQLCAWTLVVQFQHPCHRDAERHFAWCPLKSWRCVRWPSDQRQHVQGFFLSVEVNNDIPLPELEKLHTFSHDNLRKSTWGVRTECKMSRERMRILRLAFEGLQCFG